ncbi:S24 family peptidase [Litchfieldella xinjiangensis]|uniref:S24 family peptidase n=1 Tax=Litchfieldella xinjiangensis TaxID=1166948 RepID=UPI0006941483|nr:helix-turn-helix transcriptional regulator [Halomonas xinjiangensis]
MEIFKHAESKAASMLNDACFKLAKMSIHNRIDQAIRESGQSKSAIAKACGVSPSAVTQWLSGETKAPTAERLLKLARATRVSYTWLVDGKGPIRGFDELSQKAIDAFDGDAEILDTEFVESSEPVSADEVWLPIFREVEFAAGDGSTQVVENHGARERFSLPRLYHYGVQPENAALATVRGDSMHPAITDGATIGIDKGSRHIEDGKVYALDHDGMLRVKRLYRLPLGRVRVVSDNAEEFPEEVYSMADPDAPKILGRVFMSENRL